MNLFFYPTKSEILKTWNRNSSFKYFQLVRIKKQIHSFIFWEKLLLDNFVSRSTDLWLVSLLYMISRFFFQFWFIVTWRSSFRVHFLGLSWGIPAKWPTRIRARWNAHNGCKPKQFCRAWWDGWNSVYCSHNWFPSW